MTFWGLVLVIVVYYLKDFSLALGQIEKVSLHFINLGTNLSFKPVHFNWGNSNQ